MPRNRNSSRRVIASDASEEDTNQPLQTNNGLLRKRAPKRTREEQVEEEDKQRDEVDKQQDVDNATTDKDSSGDESAAVAPKSNSKPTPDVTASLRALGRHIARSISMTVDLEEAILLTPAPDLEPYQVQTNKTVVSLLRKRHPRQYSLIAKEGPGLVTSPLNEGRRDAHNQDVRDLKKHICKIYGLEDAPGVKIDWGFRWPESAKLLRPMDVEEGSEDWDALCAGNDFPDADEFPAFMWDGQNGPANPERPSDGFLMDSSLLKVARVVLFPPGYIYKTIPAPTGYAKDWGIKKMSSHLIAYVVELTRFALSSEATYAKTDFDYAGFYDNIVRHLNDPLLQEQTRQIHEFWNEQLLGQPAPAVTQSNTRRVRRRANAKPSTARFIAELADKENQPASSGLGILANAASVARAA